MGLPSRNEIRALRSQHCGHGIAFALCAGDRKGVIALAKLPKLPDIKKGAPKPRAAKAAAAKRSSLREQERARIPAKWDRIMLGRQKHAAELTARNERRAARRGA